jgi:hypothetical protein
MNRGLIIIICVIVTFVALHGFYNSFSPTPEQVSLEKHGNYFIEKRVYLNTYFSWGGAYHAGYALSFTFILIGIYLSNKNKLGRTVVLGGVVFLSSLALFTLIGFINGMWFMKAIINRQNELYFTGLSFVISLMFYIIYKYHARH